MSAQAWLKNGNAVLMENGAAMMSPECCCDENECPVDDPDYVFPVKFSTWVGGSRTLNYSGGNHLIWDDGYEDDEMDASETSTSTRDIVLDTEYYETSYTLDDLADVTCVNGRSWRIDYACRQAGDTTAENDDDLPLMEFQFRMNYINTSDDYDVYYTKRFKMRYGRNIVVLPPAIFIVDCFFSGTVPVNQLFLHSNIPSKNTFVYGISFDVDAGEYRFGGVLNIICTRGGKIGDAVPPSIKFEYFFEHERHEAEIDLTIGEKIPINTGIPGANLYFTCRESNSTLSVGDRLECCNLWDCTTTTVRPESTGNCTINTYVRNWDNTYGYGTTCNRDQMEINFEPNVNHRFLMPRKRRQNGFVEINTDNVPALFAYPEDNMDCTEYRCVWSSPDGKCYPNAEVVSAYFDYYPFCEIYYFVDFNIYIYESVNYNPGEYVLCGTIREEQETLFSAAYFMGKSVSYTKKYSSNIYYNMEEKYNYDYSTGESCYSASLLHIRMGDAEMKESGNPHRDPNYYGQPSIEQWEIGDNPCEGESKISLSQCTTVNSLLENVYCRFSEGEYFDYYKPAKISDERFIA